MVQPPTDLEQFDSLIKIVAALRGPNGCPWDLEQTHRSLTPFVIEEAHELAEAIEALDLNRGEKPDPQAIANVVGELGDLLLQVALHAEIGRGEGRFTIADVIFSISEKMVRRHPHVFSDAQVSDSKDVMKNWAEIKESEKKTKPSDRFDVSLSLPALARAQKIGEKTKRLRFDWPDAVEVMKKVDEELGELKSELNDESTGQRKRLEHELGDLLFSVVQLARHLELDAEQALRTTNNRFERRFFTMRKRIEASGLDYDQLSNDELESAWQQTKQALIYNE